MTLRDIVETVSASEAEDWHVIGGVADHDALHLGSAVYIPNPLITVQWGQVIQEDYDMPWTRLFTDKHATSSLVDVFYAGAMVFRNVMVTVDGGRVTLPIPHDLELSVPAGEVRFIKVVDRFENGFGEFDEYFRRGGLKAVDAPWPRFA